MSLSQSFKTRAIEGDFLLVDNTVVSDACDRCDYNAKRLKDVSYSSIPLMY